MSKIAVIDFETTGLDNVQDRIIQYGAVIIDTGPLSRKTFRKENRVKNIEEFSCFVEHEVSISEASRRFIGQGAFPNAHDKVEIQKNALESFIRFIGPYGIIVAHNGDVTDFRFLQQTASRCGIELPPRWRYIDTDQLARKEFPNLLRGYSLKNLHQYFTNSYPENHHTAIGDAKTLATVFMHIIGDDPIETVYEKSHKGEIFYPNF